jgi:hypothetical protein
MQLDDVLALGADDAWTVGSYGNDTSEPGHYPVVMHWDGNSWSLLPSADLDGYGGTLSGIARVGQTLAAVGRIAADPTGAPVSAPLTERYKGGSWTRTTAPDLSAYLLDAAGIAWNDAWAVGSANTGATAATLHYDGTRWSLVPSPALPGKYGAQLNGVSAVSSSDVWAVGNGIVHWDGASWTLAPAPSGWWWDVSMRRNTGYGWAVGRSDATQSYVILQHIPGSSHAATRQRDGLPPVAVDPPRRTPPRSRG